MMVVRRLVEILSLFLITIYSEIIDVEGAIITSKVNSANDLFFQSSISKTITTTITKAEVERAASILKSAGYNLNEVCDNFQRDVDNVSSSSSSSSSLHQHDRHPSKNDNEEILSSTSHHSNSQRRRTNDETDTTEEDETDTTKTEDFYIINGLLAGGCVIVAAVAAGLTMGMLSLDELDLHIKQRASDCPNERKHAMVLMPLIRDHHRLLVTFLLLNAMANEALPLFLDKIVPGYLAVILSVTLVLFFGEIIPSAVFSGPNRLAISSHLAPLVKTFLFLLAPIAVPIAKTLDFLLHDKEEDHENLQKYNRTELGALVRIQFEERLASKINKKIKKAALVGTICNDSMRDSTKRNLRESLKRDKSARYVKDLDTVNLVEGALNMHTKTVQDVMTPLRDVYGIPRDMCLDEQNVLDIYRRGHSRIPVYQCHHDDENANCVGSEGFKGMICGVFKVKQLIVSSWTESRLIKTMPLISPSCVSPSMNMLDLLNLLQTGIQMAIVCLHPDFGRAALKKNLPIPDEAGVIGIVTLEDCIEELIQEEIYDEFDQMEQLENKRAMKVIAKWRTFVIKRKLDRGEYDVAKGGEAGMDDDYNDESSRLISYGSSNNIQYDSPSISVGESMPNIV